MGVLSELFGLDSAQAPAPPPMSSVLPDAAVSIIQSGSLPSLNTSSLIADDDEVCHFVDKACLVTETTKTRYEGTHGGFNIRIAKGLTYRTGRHRSNPVKEKVPEYTPGYLYITNKRVVFVARERSFEKKLKSVTAATTYSDAIGIQFGSKTFNLLTPLPEIAAAVLHGI